MTEEKKVTTVQQLVESLLPPLEEFNSAITNGIMYVFTAAAPAAKQASERINAAVAALGTVRLPK